MYDPQNQVMVIPIQINNNLPIVEPMLPSTNQATPQPATGTPTYWQGVYIFSVNPSSGFALIGNVTQMDNALANSALYSMSSNYVITRSLYIGNTLYTISDGAVQLNSLSTFALLATVDLS
jgi:hypothetical protein